MRQRSLRRLAISVCLLLLAVAPGYSASRNISAGDMSLFWLQTNCLVMTLEAQGDENAMGFSLCFDTNLLAFVSARRGTGAGTASLNINSNQTTRGRIGFGLALPSGQTFPAGSTPIVEVCFKAAAGTGTATTPVTICDLPIGREVVDSDAGTLDATYTDATVTISGGCAYALDAAGANVPASGAVGAINVLSGPDCAWTASSGANWLSILAGGAGAGNGTVLYSAEVNESFLSRTGVVTVAGHPFTVIQSAAPCQYSLVPDLRFHGRGGETGLVNVATSGTCAWTVNNTNGWIVVGASGAGAGSFGYSVLPNPGFLARTGVVTVVDQTFTVVQSGFPCTYALEPTSRVHSPASEFAIVNVTSPEGCNWNIVNTNDWMIIKLATNGTGTGIARYTVFANPLPVERSGVLWIADLPFVITQLPAPCSYTLLRTSQLFGGAGGTGTVTVAAVEGCDWMAESLTPWIILTSTNFVRGNGGVSFYVAPSGSATDRTGYLNVAGQIFTVNQLGSGCTYSLSAASRSVTSATNTGTVTLNYVNSVGTNRCPWAVVATNGWVTTTIVSDFVNLGVGSASVRYNVSPNPGGPRSTVLYIADRPFTISQAGLPCTYSLSPSNRTHGYTPETGSFNIASLVGCAWTARATASWITITSATNGSGAGTISYRTATNTGPARTGTILVGSSTFTINQGAAGAPTFTTLPASRQVLAGANVSFTASATGTTPITFRWLHNGTNLIEGPTVTGVTTTNLTLSNVQARQAGNYALVASNIRGPSTSSPPAVLTINTVPSLAPIGSRVTTRGTTLTFRALGSDPDVPAQTLTYSIVTAPSGATINSSSGVFAWTPSTSLVVPSTNTAIIRVADNGFQPLSVTQTGLLVVVAGVTTNLPIIPVGATWKFRDTGVNLGSAWTARGYDDTAWASGPAPLGYGGTDPVTVVSFGPDEGAKYFTTYLRHRFTVTDPAAYSALAARVRRDDGVVVYLNGVELFRDNMPAGTITYQTPAASSASDEDAFIAGPALDAGLFVAGDNVLAAEVHQRSASSSDIVFDFELTGTQIASAPFIASQPQSQTVPPGRTVTMAVAASGLSPLRYQWFFAGVPLANATNATLVLPNAQIPQEGTYFVRVTNTLGTATSATAILMIRDILNTPPALGPIGNRTVSEGALLTFFATATDDNLPDQVLRYSLDPGAPAGATINPVTGAFAWTPLEAFGPGAYPITIRVTDDGTPVLADSETITVIVNEVNTPPVLISIGNRLATEGNLLLIVARATDLDLPEQTLTYSLDAGAPFGAIINPTNGVFTWTPGEADAPSTNVVTIRVTDDGFPALNASETITITVIEGNAPPVFNPIGDKTIAEGSLLIFVCSATDSDFPTQRLTYSLDPGAPNGVTLNPTNGVFAWLPTEADGPSTNFVTIRVTDNGAIPLSATETIRIVVNELNSLPTLTPIGNKTVVEGRLLAFSCRATDLDLPPQAITYSLDPGAPAGASINPTNGIFVWTPAEADGPATHQITIRAADSGFPALSASETIAVTVLETNAAPVLLPITDKLATRGVALSFPIAVVDTDLPRQALTFSLDAGAPAGASVNTNGLFNWTPALSDPPALHSVTVRVVDDGVPPLSAAATFNIVVVSGLSTNVSLISSGSVWRFRDTGEDLGAGWTATNFNDCGWPSGRAKLGYGIGDESTLLGFGPDSTARFITTYFRTWFTIDNPSALRTLNLRVRRDDGVVVYLNGTEVFRDNMPAGPVNHLTIASSSIGADEALFVASPALGATSIVAGANLVCAEIHQRSGASPDLSFDLELTGTVIAPAGQPLVPPVVGTVAPRLHISLRTDGMVALHWNAMPCLNYRVQYTENLGAGVWTNLGGALNATDPIASVVNPVSGSRQRFYRVVIVD